MLLQETIVTFDSILIALVLTSFAGLTTTLGAALPFLLKKPSIRVLAIGLGFSGGVMLAISFIELLPSAILEFENFGLSPSNAFFWGNFWFFAGIFFIFFIDLLIPHVYKEEDSGGGHSHGLLIENNHSSLSKNQIQRLGLLTALGIAVHNFPEGLVTFTSSLKSIELGIVLAVAVGLHNIPEGLSVSIPIITATGDKWHAFRLGLLSGLAEPIGALIAAIVLYPFLSAEIIGASIAFVSGIMVFISFDELLPAAKSADDSHLVTLGIIGGMIVMSLTLWMFT